MHNLPTPSILTDSPRLQIPRGIRHEKSTAHAKAGGKMNLLGNLCVYGFHLWASNVRFPMKCLGYVCVHAILVYFNEILRTIGVITFHSLKNHAFLASEPPGPWWTLGLKWPGFKTFIVRFEGQNPSIQIQNPPMQIPKIVRVVKTSCLLQLTEFIPPVIKHGEQIHHFCSMIFTATVL